MRRFRLALLLSLVLASSAALGGEKRQVRSAPGRTLVVYFSRTGNTKDVANLIHAAVGGGIVEIEVRDAYPSDYEATKKRAAEEQAAGYKPPLKTKVADLGSYDVVFLGFPIWWARLPPPVVTFASEHDLAGKTIVPFCTHAGSGFGQTLGELRELYPKSTFRDGLAVWGRDAKTSGGEVTAWLRRIEFQK